MHVTLRISSAPPPPPRSCVRPDQSSATVRCHYLTDGTVNFAFTMRRAEYFIPAGVLLKCFLEVGGEGGGGGGLGERGQGRVCVWGGVTFMISFVWGGGGWGVRGCFHHSMRATREKIVARGGGRRLMRRESRGGWCRCVHCPGYRRRRLGTISRTRAIPKPAIVRLLRTVYGAQVSDRELYGKLVSGSAPGGGAAAFAAERAELLLRQADRHDLRTKTQVGGRCGGEVSRRGLWSRSGGLKEGWSHESGMPTSSGSSGW